jgi:hypothetical protein
MIPRFFLVLSVKGLGMVIIRQLYFRERVYARLAETPRLSVDLQEGDRLEDSVTRASVTGWC